MGAINSAFNQAAGAIAGSALAIKHAKQTDESKMNVAEHSALVARNQARDAEAEYDKAKAENEFITDENGKTNSLIASSFIANRKLNEAEAAFDEVKNLKNTSPKTVEKKLNDLMAAKSAADALNAKLDAIDNMRTRAIEQRAYADKANQLAEREQQRYKSKWEWGGK